ncbi:MAG TPA: hypothetical protein VMD91_08730 [Candidatus Sulfotelmatobacter sp.]|nr:hypothetical protein [Candidatus Sulfotelmatobacter sp.]
MLREMAALEAAGLFADVFAPLTTFAHGLSLRREGDVVQWTYAGQSAIIAQHDAGSVSATFVGEPAPEAVSGTLAAPAYLARGAAIYPMTRDGCARMVDDMVAFFGGVREPRFAFVEALTAA